MGDTGLAGQQVIHFRLQVVVRIVIVSRIDGRNQHVHFRLGVIPPVEIAAEQERFQFRALVIPLVVIVPNVGFQVQKIK